MKKYFIQFLIISISFWILFPLVDLFVSGKSIRGVDVYMNNILIVKSMVFPDHYQYTNNDIKKIKKLAKDLKTNILTTEKDFMRIKNNKQGIDYLKVNLLIKERKNLINFLKKNI